MSAWLAYAITAGGALLLILAAWGVCMLPDALSRQHAATKAATLALTLVCVGVALLEGSLAWSVRLLLIVAFLMATWPVGAHLLARAAVRDAGLDDEARRAPTVGADAAAGAEHERSQPGRRA